MGCIPPQCCKAFSCTWMTLCNKPASFPTKEHFLLFELLSVLSTAKFPSCILDNRGAMKNWSVVSQQINTALGSSFCLFHSWCSRVSLRALSLPFQKNFKKSFCQFLRVSHWPVLSLGHHKPKALFSQGGMSKKKEENWFWQTWEDQKEGDQKKWQRRLFSQNSILESLFTGRGICWVFAAFVGPTFDPKSSTHERLRETSLWWMRLQRHLQPPERKWNQVPLGQKLRITWWLNEGSRLMDHHCSSLFAAEMITLQPVTSNAGGGDVFSTGGDFNKWEMSFEQIQGALHTKNHFVCHRFEV